MKKFNKLIALMLCIALTFGIVTTCNAESSDDKNITLKVKNTGKELVLSWNLVKLPNGGSYWVTRIDDLNGYDCTLLKETTKTSYTIKNPDRRMNYYLEICVQHPYRTFSSNKVKVCFKPSKTNPKLKYTVSGKNVKLKWNKVDCVGYKVYRYSNGKWKRAKTIIGMNNTSFTDKSLKKGTYYYFIRPFCYDKNGKEVNGGKKVKDISLKSGRKVKVVVK